MMADKTMASTVATLCARCDREIADELTRRHNENRGHEF
jgi:hypothetical protein